MCRCIFSELRKEGKEKTKSQWKLIRRMNVYVRTYVWVKHIRETKDDALMACLLNALKEVLALTVAYAQFVLSAPY